MGAERDRQKIPAWARRERQGDFRWIGENLDNFWPFAREACRGMGRGVIVVDTTLQPAEAGGHPFGYLSGVELAQFNDEDTACMVGNINVPRTSEGYCWRTSSHKVNTDIRVGCFTLWKGSSPGW